MARGARVVAGGTDLVVGARQGKAPLPREHRRDPSARGATPNSTEDGSLKIGALVTHADTAADPVVRSRLTALADASAIVGSHATRAFGTIGGNLMNASPAMETGGPLLCFDSTVTLRSQSGTRTSWLDELLPAPASRRRRPASCWKRCRSRCRPWHGQRIRAARVPPPDGDRGCWGDGGCLRSRQDVLPLLGSPSPRWRRPSTASPTPRRRSREATVELTRSQAAARAVAAATKPISDVRASADYRRAMAAVIARRAIEVALARARGEHVGVPATAAVHGGVWVKVTATLRVNGIDYPVEIEPHTEPAARRPRARRAHGREGGV